MKSRLTLCSTFLALFIQENQGQQENPKKCFWSCPDGWEIEEDSCYLWTDEKKTWDEAERYCNNKGGHLASVTNLNIHNYIWSRAKSRDQKQEGHWIGGNYVKDEVRWQWSDRSKWEFTKWATKPMKQPNNVDVGDQNCLIVYNKYALDGWNDVSCENVPRKFVCVCPLCNNQHISIPSDIDDESNGKGEFPISFQIES